MMNLFEMYYNSFLKNIFDDKKSNYIDEVRKLEKYITEHLTQEMLSKFKDFEYALKSHYEDIALEEIEKAFYRGMRYGCDLNLFISEDDDE